jgi:1-acyl-sn-glycerol-3-phosphate acyltransferase
VRGGGRGGFGAASTVDLDLGHAPGAAGHPAGAEPTGPDPFGLDLFIRDNVRPICRFLFERYWRVEVMGAQHVPSGPVLLIANHSGALPFDGAMICTAVDLHCNRVARFLYDRFVEGMGPIATFYRKVGGASASRENAVALLEQGEPVLLFPEGVSGVAKPFTDRYRLRSFSAGFARIALALDVPVVPVAVVGAEEIYPMVGRAEGVGRVVGAPYVPITPFFPLLGPLGALPLPTKWFIRFGKPIRFTPVEEEARWMRAKVEAVRVRRKVQAMVTRLKRRRRSVFFG